MITMQKQILSLEDARQEFIVDCKVRNLSQDTIDYYNQSIDYFFNYLHEMYYDLKICDIKKSTIDNYIMYMQKKSLKDTTINTKLRGIRSVLYYFMQNDYVGNFKIKLIKEDELIPELYSDDEIKILLKKPNLKTCNFSEYRTWAIINFFIATGVRSRTLRNIKTKDLDFQNNLIYLTTTKVRKMLVIPMSNAIKKVLLEYLKIRGSNLEDYTFCNLEGNQLSRGALNNIIRKYNLNRNVKKTGVHLFRHYFAKNYIQNGGNALKLQKLLGHSTLEQTKRYVDLFSQDLQTDFEKYNPLDNINEHAERIKITF